jgi:hypothetical protein
MAKKFRWTLILAVLGVMVGGLWFIGGEVAAQPTQFQSTNVFELTDAGGELQGPPFENIPGAATLLRTNKGISYRIYTTQLDPGAAYTVWVVVFNRPENCENGCDGADLNSPDVEGSVVHGSGYIAGENGTGNFAGSLESFDLPAGIQVNVPAGTANGLKDPFKAEIHLVVRNHGGVITDLADQQLSTFGGGCNADSGGTLEDGFFCADRQAAVFPSLDGGDGDGENEG